MPIHFFSESIPFILPNKAQYQKWIQAVIDEHEYNLGYLNYIFCSDDHLLKINQKYLNHDFYTDIITFNMADDPETIEAEIFISVDRVQTNAADLGDDPHREMARVIIHGVLHLLGYDDKTAGDQKVMQEKEEACLSLLKF